jgi:hypothetical protein
MRALLALSLALGATAPAAAARILSYDRKLAVDAPAGWFACPSRAFAAEKEKPAFCLEKKGAEGPPPLLVMDIALNQAYDAKASLKDIAARDLAARRKKVKSGKFTELKPVKFREDLEGESFRMSTGEGAAFELFYFTVGGKGYYATCVGDRAKDCFAVLKSVRPAP